MQDMFDTEDCDDSAAMQHVIESEPPLTILPLSDWLGALASALGGDLGNPTPKVGLSSPRTRKAAVAAPMT